MEYIWPLIALVVGFWAGWRLRGTIISWTISEHPEKFIEALAELQQLQQSADSVEPDQDGRVELSVERVGNQLYAYTKQGDEFIAQGPDLETLLELAHRRFPDRLFFGTIDSDSPAKELATKK